jgi:CHASE3 domain sensor protein
MPISTLRGRVDLRAGSLLLALTVVLLVIGSLGLNVLANNVRNEQDAVSTTTLDLERTIKLMDDMETSMRGFVISGQDSFLQPYTLAKAGR